MRPVNNTVNIETPVMAKYGVLSPASTTIDLTQHSDFLYSISDAGIEVENAVIAGGDPGGTVQIVANNEHDRFLRYFPFNVQTSISVSTMGNSPEEIEEAAMDALNIVIQKSIEKELWEGGIAKLLDDSEGNRSLAQAAAVDLTPTPGTGVKPKYALALLEGALGENTIGYQGVIHAPRVVASTLKFKPEDDTLFTNLGTKVIAGVGYTTTGPDGTKAPAGKAWMFATGPVTVLLGKTEIIPEKLNQAIDVSKNQISYFVDRPAAVLWSTADLFAVLVDLTLDYA